MPHKKIEELLEKLRQAAGQPDAIEALPAQQAEELGGGIDFVCENLACNAGCPQQNAGCSPR